MAKTETENLSKSMTSLANGKTYEKIDPELLGRGGGMRHNEGKLRFDLLQPLATEDLTKVMTKGALKYAERNWEKGMNWSTVLASLKRHISEFEKAQDYDSETGLLHISHAAANIHFLNAYYYIYPQGDDRPKRWKDLPKIGLDIDEVLANWVGPWREKFGIENVPNSWFFDREIKNRFETLAKNGELDEFYMGLPTLIKSVDLPLNHIVI